MKRLLLALVAILLPLAAAPLALAHTAVRETSITDNATLSAAPENFTVTFSAATGLANVNLTNAAGRNIALDYAPPHAMATSFTIMRASMSTSRGEPHAITPPMHNNPHRIVR